MNDILKILFHLACHAIMKNKVFFSEIANFCKSPHKNGTDTSPLPHIVMLFLSPTSTDEDSVFRDSADLQSNRHL